MNILPEGISTAEPTWAVGLLLQDRNSATHAEMSGGPCGEVVGLRVGCKGVPGVSLDTDEGSQLKTAAASKLT